MDGQPCCPRAIVSNAYTHKQDARRGNLWGIEMASGDEAERALQPVKEVFPLAGRVSLQVCN